MAPLDNGDPHPKKVGAHWLHFIPAQAQPSRTPNSRPQQSHTQHPQPRRIPPCVQHLARWHVHIRTIFSPPDQANSLYKLATECQVLGVKLAKKFQVLLGLEAMHCNSIQGTVHETLTLGCSAQEATYSAIMWDRVPDDECEATTHHLHSEANVAWKEMHEVMYNHQLHYDGQLATFLMDTEMALDDMQGKVWDAIHTLAENEGITFNACLGLMLQVLNLLLQVPIDISFHTQIPVTNTYCLESSVYRRWHPEQDGVSPLHKEIRAFCTLSKVLGRVTHQPSESAGGPPSPAPSDHSTGSGGSRHQSHSRAQSITHARSQ